MKKTKVSKDKYYKMFLNTAIDTIEEKEEYDTHLGIMVMYTTDYPHLRKNIVPKLTNKLIGLKRIDKEQKKNLDAMVLSKDRADWYMAFVTIKNLLDGKRR